MSTSGHGRRALDQPIRPTRAEIDLGALERNYEALKALAGETGILAVVKANAYGHGAVPIARALEGHAVTLLGVALVEEGIELRNAGIRAPILVLGGSYAGGYAQIVEHGLTPSIFRVEHVRELAAAAANRPVKVHLKVDTGMGRIGALPSELPGILEELRAQPRIELEGVLSHFANADVANDPLTAEQLRGFRDAVAIVEKHGFRPKWRHIANSSAFLDRSRELGDVNLIRPGISLYGLPPAAWLAGRAPLEPVLSWKTAITHVKTIPAGTAVSYGSTWRAARESRIATLPVGYADGYGREYSNRAHVLVRGRRAPVVGRVTMDMTLVDVTDVAGAEVGDEVVLIGSQGADRIGAEELAGLAGTIHYEVLCAVGARVPRVVIPHGQRR